MTAAKLKLIRKELLALKKRDGVILTRAAYEQAKNPRSAMHSELEWDQEKAAEAHRLSQVRAIIDIVIVESGELQGQRQYVSLWIKRGEPPAPGRAYIDIQSCLGDPELRQQLLEELVSDLKRLAFKSQPFPELKKVREVIERL